MKVLCVTWDGGGNLNPMLGTARQLVADGHDVRVMCHDRPADWVEITGSRFVPYDRCAAYDSTAPHVTGEDELRFLWSELWFSPTHAADVVSELDREPSDVVVADHMLAGAFCAAEAVEAPAVVLFHQPWSFYHSGQFGDLWRTATPLLDRIRGGLGLPGIGEPQLLWADRPWIVASIPELGVDLPAPAGALHVGPITDHPPGSPPAPVVTGEEPVIAVSSSTTQMGQVGLLQTIIDGLATLPIHAVVTTGPAVEPERLRIPPNIDVVRYARHEDLLAGASLMVNHAGHGVVLAALARGVPMVCTPIGRDQPAVAERVAQLGVGRTLLPGFSSDDLAAAVRAVLSDEHASTSARDLAESIATCRRDEAIREVIARVATNSAI